MPYSKPSKYIGFPNIGARSSQRIHSMGNPINTKWETKPKRRMGKRKNKQVILSSTAKALGYVLANTAIKPIHSEATISNIRSTKEGVIGTHQGIPVVLFEDNLWALR